MPIACLYRYEWSPYSDKVQSILQLKGIDHYAVQVPNMPPRPELSALGVGYRRIPVLIIGRDIYCDTGRIVNAIESHCSHRSIYPTREDGSNDATFIWTWSKHYVERIVTLPVVQLIPWEKFPPAFIDDRSQLLGAPIDVKTMADIRPLTLSKLTTELHLIEEQLADGREWMMNTVTPSLADFSVFFVMNWLRKPHFSYLRPYPLVSSHEFSALSRWIERFDKLLKFFPEPPLSASGDHTKVSPIESQRLSVQFGDIVSIYPEDTGRDGVTTGRLIELDSKEVVIEVEGQAGMIRCHFLRSGYRIQVAKSLEVGST
ncbi:hypothetical protein DL96DRAFT_1599528 [Flagelloscypha sp. PMI_526]|nr:hypothetical protein DL96DRAFT_1599528 [Flagelloscypha sp. PMI_526]